MEERRGYNRDVKVWFAAIEQIKKWMYYRLMDIEIDNLVIHTWSLQYTLH